MPLGPFLASGTERDVYRHRGDPSRVIKIRREMAHIDRNAVEAAYYQNAPTHRFRQIPRFYGWVDTHLGPGLEYELIMQTDGNPCRRLLENVHDRVIPVEDATLLLERFFVEAIACGLIIYDEGLGNLLYQPQTGRLFMVDGFGPRSWNLRNCLRSKFRLLARKKTIQCRDKTLVLWKEAVQSLR